MKIIGIVPARMAASRFPGKPLFKIKGRAMVEHCFRRAAFFDRWDGLFLATCDKEIESFGRERDIPVIMTKSTHVRALDRVAEATEKCGLDVQDDDIVVCVQGDEPLLANDMLEAVIVPLEKDPKIGGTMLAVHIVDEEQYRNPDIVKIAHDLEGNVLYTSRSPIPYAKEFSPALEARRVGGIFGFRWHFLKLFTSLPESPLEKKEACDSNRFCDHGYRQRIAPVPYRPYFSVDSPTDVGPVEKALEADPLWGKY